LSRGLMLRVGSVGQLRRSSSVESMRGKTCIITGATGGIGLETARRLGALGARLVLVGRNRDKGNAAISRLRAEVPGVAVEMHHADLSRPDEIRRLADALLKTASRIDVLVNNAGAVFANRNTTPDGLELTFALNHMGYFRLMALLRDRLIASAPARVVNVASEAHRGSHLDFEDLQCSRRYRGWKAYQRSKLANILFTRELARRLEGTGVTANCLHPGFVARTQANCAARVSKRCWLAVNACRRSPDMPQLPCVSRRVPLGSGGRGLLPAAGCRASTDMP